MKGFKLRTKHKNNHAVAKAIVFLFVILSSVGAYITYFLQGTNIAPLNPKGSVASEQADLIYLSFGIVVAVAIPTLGLLYFFAWKYRETNNHASYRAEARQGKGFAFSIWAGPTLIMVLLTAILIPATHRLDPKKAAANGTAPMTIQVIAMRWKWVFLYPEQQIATVNTVTIPKDQPVIFELTADETPMSSFWIPNLGGQLYAMTGHVNRLSLVGSHIGSYPGSSAEINGEGFAGMRFTANVTSSQDFNSWVTDVKRSPNRLDSSVYAAMLKPSEDEPAANYGMYTSDLYSKAVMKYMGAHSSHTASNTKHEGHTK